MEFFLEFLRCFLLAVKNKINIVYKFIIFKKRFKKWFFFFFLKWKMIRGSRHTTTKRRVEPASRGFKESLKLLSKICRLHPAGITLHRMCNYKRDACCWNLSVVHYWPEVVKWALDFKKITAPVCIGQVLQTIYFLFYIFILRFSPKRRKT